MAVFIGHYLQTYHQSSKMSDAVKGLSYSVFLYIKNWTEKEEKVEKREKENCLRQMGYSRVHQYCSLLTVPSGDCLNGFTAGIAFFPCDLEPEKQKHLGVLRPLPGLGTVSCVSQ